MLKNSFNCESSNLGYVTKSGTKKKTLLEWKYLNSLIEVGTLRAREIPLQVLSQPKTTKNFSFQYYLQSQQSKRFSYDKTKLW